MSKKMAFTLLAYGITLAGLGVLLQQSSPVSATIAFVTALIGGGLSLLWGCMSALVSRIGRTWPILTLIPVVLTLLTELVHSLFEGYTTPLPLLALTLMLLITMAMLLYLFHGERPAGFYDADAAHRRKPSADIKRL